VLIPCAGGHLIEWRSRKASLFFSLLRPCPPTHCRCRGILLNLITLSDTHTHTHIHAHARTRARAHTRARTHTRARSLGRTPLDEGSAHHIGLYLITRNGHKIQIFMPTTVAEFEPTIPTSERPETYPFDRVTTGIGLHY
jgi:hypothetical protein